MALIGAVAGGRWLGLSLHVVLGSSGSAFDLANAAVALALLYSITSRYARGGVATLRAFAVLAALALSSRFFL